MVPAVMLRSWITKIIIWDEPIPSDEHYVKSMIHCNYVC